MGMFVDSGIPNDAHTFIGSCMGGPGVSVVAFTPSGGWVVVAPNGSYMAEGIPQDCFTQLGTVLKNGWTVRSIAFPPAGGDSWVIVADQGYYASNIPNECFQTIGTYFKNGWKISCVAFPPAGGDSWVIIANNAMNASNIDDQCFQTLCNYTQGNRRATQVAFGPKGGWVIYGDEAYFANGSFNAACFAQIKTFENQNWLVGHVALTASGGWSVICNAVLPQSPDPLRVFENFFLQDGSNQWHTIYDRMSFHGVAGASVAFVQNNAVAWRTSYGVLQAGGNQYVYTNTPFQAASISKPHAAIGVQLLAQNNKIALTDTIGSRTTWPVAKRACAQAAWVQQSTIQLTLEHKGGFIGRGNTDPPTACSGFNGDGGGFGGYTNTPGVTLPTLDQILSGTSPANSPPIEISTQPGSFYYSGMGYVVLMRMIQDVTGTDFRTWMQTNVLTPLGMTASTYALNLPAGLSRAAAGHATNGQPIAGLRNLYPEASAAGLYTNAGDLCQIIIMLNSGGKVNGTQLLSAAQAKAMLTSQIGIFVNSDQPNQPGYLFNHNGENYGFTAMIQGYPNQSAGMAIMVNRDDGDGNASAFYTEVINALIRVYGLQT